MIKRSNIRRQTVELGSPAPRPSRIRREPVPVKIKREVQPDPAEREAWVVIVGVILFALAITVITVGASNYIN